MIEGIHDPWLFVAAGLALNLTPGADVALIAARSTAQGFRAGAAAAVGVGAGCLVHTLAAALGVSALLAESSLAFTVLRWLGAAYLVWLGLGLLRGPAATPAVQATQAPPVVSVQRVFWQGFLTNALNPKVALFFLAFVPQFIDAGAPNKALAFAVLGGVFVVNGTLVNLGFAAVLSTLGRRLGGDGRVGRWLGRGAGLLFVVLGLRLALGEDR
ncbi:LysE family translocator [Ideonella sp. A 288]|uniref:LysE family translocator n=1 Tax=Ideonella sp. A 288 TaxID=1962181 RepID=UPI002872BF86|nr:LysE family translocator [Ideonella sp. A 288]